MSTQTSERSLINGKAENSRPKAVIRSSAQSRRGSEAIIRVLPAWIVSGVVHAILLLIFFLTTMGVGTANPTVEPDSEGQLEDLEKAQDLTPTEVGIIPGEDTNYNNSRIADVSIPGPVDATASIGLKDAPPDGVQQTIPPPLGAGGRGTGGGFDDPANPGMASALGTNGGYYGVTAPGGLGLRGGSGATREQRAIEGGGSKETEAAVGRGLAWLAMHQDMGTGKWSLDAFNHFGHEKGNSGKTFTCSCTNGGQKNDIGGTALGLLPFLGAGITHKKAAVKDPRFDYTKNVYLGLKFLMSKQGADGYFGGGMYAHGLATIAVCEAYAMTSDPELKAHAQHAIDLIVKVQHPGGGWRYDPKPTSGDTSVVGWQVMALRSGQMAGLSVPAATIKGAEKFLDSVQTSNGANYKYTSDMDATPTMTAAGLLCREYLGWTPKNPGLINGVKFLAGSPPDQVKSIYYQYYATQVMHHFGGENWTNWNAKQRDLLVKTQDKGNDAKHEHQAGSWSPAGDPWGPQGGRLMQTSLSLLTLEVYYRYMPLYRREGAAKKEMVEMPEKTEKADKNKPEKDAKPEK
ncbi:MAG: prenyltransferase/squalene oxidase repeat-containing protein [Gemmataceae bacterium]